jgi:hypothetical protein
MQLLDCAANAASDGKRHGPDHASSITSIPPYTIDNLFNAREERRQRQ